MKRTYRIVLAALLCVVLNVAAQAQGTWGAVTSIPVSGMTNGKMFYQILLLNYTGTGARSPVLVYEHENSEGDKCYPNNPGACAQLTAPLASGGSGVQDWYNNAGFQNRYCSLSGAVPSNGCIVVSVAADQTSDPSGQTSNFGGYGDTPGSEPNERGVIAVIQQVLATLNADPNRVYVTGDSLGGIGSQAIGLDYGIGTGTQGHIVTATMPFSGAIFRGNLTAPTSTQLAQLQGGGFQFNINGTGDTGTSSNPALWTEPLWRAITGNSNYPGQPLGGRAGSSPIYVLVDTSLGHDVWDTYRPLPAGQPMLDLLFSQVAGSSGGPACGTNCAPLPAGYLSTAGNQIMDGSGNNVRLACTGYDKPTASPNADMTKMRAQGFNCVRVPWFDKITCPGGSCNFTTFDTIVNAATANNMKVIFDHHGNEGADGSSGCLNQQANGLWYDLGTNTNGTDGCGTAGTVTYTLFRSNSIAFATHYSGNTTVIGFDLHNEPTTFGNPACCGGSGGGGSGQFQIQNGQIIDPSGNVFVAHGINVDEEEAPKAITNAAAQPLTTLFPNINFIRVPVRQTSNVGQSTATYPNPATYATFIANATANHIVVELEDHSSNGGQWECFISGPLACTPSNPPTGGALTTMTNFWASVAQMYKGNPYVWIGSLNEINSADGTYALPAIAAITTYQNALYNAVRATGNNNIIQMGNGVGGGNPGTVGVNSGQNASLTANWHNVTWYMHSYYTNGTPSGALAQVQGSTAACCGGSGGSGYIGAQTLHSGDGVVPVIFDEYGSGTGAANSNDATSMVSAMTTVQGLGVGSAGWAWFPSTQWQMVNNGDTAGGPFSLTTWGTEVSNMIKGFPANPPITPPSSNPPPAIASAQGFNTLTFGPSLSVGNTPNPSTSYPTVSSANNWYPFTFFGGSWQNIGFTRNPDGSITLDGTGERFGDGLSTAVVGTGIAARLNFLGAAFGGGGYFEAEMKCTGPCSFWANDIETMNGASQNLGTVPWPGQPAGVGDWIETDIAEFDLTNRYGWAYHNWYGDNAPGNPQGPSGTYTPGAHQFYDVLPNWGGPIGIPTPGSPDGAPWSPPPGVDFTQYNKYGMLWVPATSTTPGFIKTYFNGQQVGNTLLWNQYNPASPPPPGASAVTNCVAGTYGQVCQSGPNSAWSVLDTRHLSLILGGATGGGSTVTFKSISVWQANTNNDIGVTPPSGPVVGANWGTGNAGDMKAMVEDVGAAVEAAAPGSLIIVEGIFNNSTLFNGTARGSGSFPITSGSIMDLTGIGSQPVLCCSGHVLYSVHDMPASLFAVAPDSGSAATTMRTTAWGYLETQNRAPVWVGKMGASLDNSNGQLSDETGWASGLTQYLNGQLAGQGGPSFTGCQQPMSGDWWDFGNNASSQPNGTLNPDGTSKAGQQTYWGSMLYIVCNGVGGGGPGATAWNPLDASAGIALTNSNQTATSSTTGSQSVRSTTSQTGGKFCEEITATSISPNWDVGISSSAFVLTTGAGLGSDSNGIGFDPNSAGGLQGIFFNNAVLSTGATPSVTGEKATICEDLDNKLLWVTDSVMRAASTPWNNSATANPATGTGGISFAGVTCPCFITWNTDEASSATLNASGPFAVATPSGFAPWQAAVVAGAGNPFVMTFP